MFGVECQVPNAAVNTLYAKCKTLLGEMGVAANTIDGGSPRASGQNWKTVKVNEIEP